MRRKRVSKIPDIFIPSQETKITKKSFKFELITPMFGGDAESWQLDLKNPVRCQAVKGQLRFWWRTMQNETEPKKLLQKENRLWGGKIVDNDNKEESKRIKSPVSISISDYDINKENIELAKMANNYAVDNKIMPTYVLFPITEDVKKNRKEIYFIKKLSFTLNISYSQLNEQEELEMLNTLKLWTLFGGIGARTRRGAGSIFCEKLLKDFCNEADIYKFLSSISNQVNTDNNNNQLEYPRISGMIFYVKNITLHTKEEPASPWKSLLESYGRYRQDRKQDRRPGGHPGRSYWPEPDAIREISKDFKKHKPCHPDKKWFPRTAFGLPILVKFKDKCDPGGGDNINIEPDIGSGERYPSPVILKIIKLNNGSILQSALILNQKFPDKLKLRVNNKDYTIDGNMLPFHTGYETSKKMRVGHELNGQSIYENLANHLNLQEVTI